MAPSNKRKNNSTANTNKIKKINSYFKPVDSITLEQETHVYKKVKLQTRTLLKHKLVSNESDEEEGNNDDKKIGNNNKEEDKEEVLEDKSKEKKKRQEEVDKQEKDIDKEKEQQVENEEEDKEEEEEEEEEEEDKAITSITTKMNDPNQGNISITETQELDTQNVPLFSTQTQTQTDTIGSPITYTVADEDDIEDSFFDLSKSINTQTNDNEKKKEDEVEYKQQQEEEEDDDFIFSSTQESSLDDIFISKKEKESHVNIVSLDQDGLDFSQTTTDDNFKLLNLPDTNLSFPSSTLE